LILKGGVTMGIGKCPICGCEEFYVKNPEDDYETYEFRCENGEIHFGPDIDKEKVPDINDEIETHCNRCRWHDKLEKLKK
jgi:hypothetical protein